jgi:hypothetical protein
MSDSNLGRRNFGRLALVATGAMVVGARDATAQDSKASKDDLGVDPSLLIAAPNACKRLNTCKGTGGYGGYPGQNTCKGKGECGVPLKAETAKSARKQFEQLMKAAGKKVGPAPK